MVEDFHDSSASCDSVSVLISGAVNVANNKWNACYWENDTVHILETNHSLANDILVLDGKIIIGGEYEGKPCFWENGNRKVIDCGHNGTVKAIGVLNGDIHIVGQIYDDHGNPKSFIWTKGAMSLLSSGTGYASDISFSGKDVYVSGMDSEKACYWKNGSIVVLSKTLGHGYGIEVRGTDVYVAGEYRPSNGGYYKAGYWKNGEFISPAGNSVYLWNLGVNLGNVYLVGRQVLFEKNVLDNAVCIKENEKIFLESKGNVSTAASDIAFNGATEYVLGSFNGGSVDQQQFDRVCYWRNNRLHEIPSKSPALGSAIYLEPVH
ncbi:hypothetical protein [Dyadobacter aurulentus]|uniref:hypothetical protein n=1 Tax=Dyadobacter sp. UC 10 TaxID=2605428 RepID=UPI0011F3CA56|nr:hypothetical protein [Dyadobacter sp. UC 10]KAA0989557.1 hypothetical protein FXO21_04950 [Dyadobacter sp. UC 10]